MLWIARPAAAPGDLVCGMTTAKAANEFVVYAPSVKGAGVWRARWIALVGTAMSSSPTSFSAQRRVALLVADAVATACALQLALWLRFEGQVPAQYADALPLALLTLVAFRMASNFSASLHRWSFRLSGLSDAVRLGLAALCGSALFVLVYPLLVPGGLPRSVYALELFLATTAFGALRFGPRFGVGWMGERVRTWSGAERTLIVGSGSEAELLARELQRSPESKFLLVGFVNDDPSMVGCRIDGRVVLGLLED